MTQYLLALEIARKQLIPEAIATLTLPPKKSTSRDYGGRVYYVISTRTIDIPGVFTTKVRNEALCQRIAWISAYFFQGMPSPIKMQPKIAT